MNHGEELALAFAEYYQHPTRKNLAAVDYHAAAYEAIIGDLEPGVADEIRALHKNTLPTTQPFDAPATASLSFLSADGVRVGALLIPWSIITFSAALWISTMRENRRNKQTVMR